MIPVFGYNGMRDLIILLLVRRHADVDVAAKVQWRVNPERYGRKVFLFSSRTFSCAASRSAASRA
jgi:hypothetical protein